MPSRQDHIRTTVTKVFDLDSMGVAGEANGRVGNGTTKLETKVERKVRTKQIIKTIHQVLTYCEKTIEKDIEDLTPLQRVTVWLNLQEYVRPKLSRVEQTGQDGGPVRHNHTIVLRASEPMLTEASMNEVKPMSLEDHSVNELPYEIAPNASNNQLQLQPLTVPNHENREMQAQTQALLISSDGESRTVVASLDENGHVIYNTATIRDIPPISDNDYVNTIPETPTEEI